MSGSAAVSNATLVAAVIAAVVAAIGMYYQRKTGRETAAAARVAASELDVRAKREEAMRNMRWAAELAVSADERKVELGVSQLTALAESEDLLDEALLPLVDAALAVVVAAPADAIEEIVQEGGDVLVVEAGHDDAVWISGHVDPDLSSSKRPGVQEAARNGEDEDGHGVRRPEEGRPDADDA